MQNARLRQRPVNQLGQQQLRDSVSAWDDVRAHAIGSLRSPLGPYLAGAAPGRRQAPPCDGWPSAAASQIIRMRSCAQPVIQARLSRRRSDVAPIAFGAISTFPTRSFMQIRTLRARPCTGSDRDKNAMTAARKDATKICNEGRKRSAASMEKRWTRGPADTGYTAYAPDFPPHRAGN